MCRPGSCPGTRLSISVHGVNGPFLHTVPLLVPAKTMLEKVFGVTSIVVMLPAPLPAAPKLFVPLARSPVIAFQVEAPSLVCQMRQVPKYNVLGLLESMVSGGVKAICSEVIPESAGAKLGVGPARTAPLNTDWKTRPAPLPGTHDV